MEGQLKIHSENILPIIKKWLYSSKDIFLRELVSNACDALTKYSKISGSQEGLRVDISLDKGQRRLTIADSGIGMTAGEVEKYIAQIAFSGAEEFMAKYANPDEKNQVIGHFGLGFYSAYMVASSVTIDTLSFQDGATAALWTCDGSSSYTLVEGNRKERGTSIILTIDPSEDEALDESYLRQILQRYCGFLPFPIYLNGALINEKEPLWLKSISDCSEKDYLDFYRTLFPFEAEPLFWIHLNVDFPFNLKGILYFPRLSEQREWKTDSIKLFCNRVFVSDDCQDILPKFLTMLQGVIDSPDIPLNVSRSALQVDKTVKQVGQHISKKVADRLSALFKEDRNRYLAIWEDLEPIVKFGLLNDEKFYDRMKEALIFKTVKGEWLTPEAYISGKSEKTVYYAPPEMSQHPLVESYQARGHEIFLIRSTPLDLAVIHNLEEKLDMQFLRIDAQLDEQLLDPSSEKTVLDANGQTLNAKLASFFQKKLGLSDKDVEAKSLANTQLPAIMTFSEQQRRLRDQLAFQKKGALPFKPTLVLNTNHKLIHTIYNLSEKSPELAQKLAEHVQDLALLSHREMDVDKMNQFIARSTELIDTLTSSA